MRIRVGVVAVIVVVALICGTSLGMSYPSSPVSPPSTSNTNVTTSKIVIPSWLEVEQINASWVKTPTSASSTYIVAASDSVNKEHANWVCDGTSDHVEINMALANCTSGGTVTLMEGTYLIDGIVNISYDNVTLTGSGYGARIVSDYDGVDYPPQIININDTSYVTISNLRVFFDNAGGVNYAGVTVNDTQYATVRDVYFTIYAHWSGGYYCPDEASIYANGACNLTIDGCIFNWTCYGVDLHASPNCNIGDCYFNNSYCWASNYGHHLAVRDSYFNYENGYIYIDACNYSVVDGNTFSHVDDGAVISNLHHCSMTGNTVHTDARAFKLGGGASHCTVSGNTVDAWQDHLDKAITIREDYNTVSGNTIDGHGDGEGIYIYGGASSDPAEYNTITGNTIYNCDYGIRVNLGLAHNNNIQGNTIHDSDDTGIDIGYYANNSLVSGNTVYDSGSRGISVWGDDIAVIDNYVYGSGDAGIYLVSQGKRYFVSGNTVRHGGTGTYAVSMTNAGVEDVLIDGNDFYMSGATGDVNDVGTDTVYGGNRNNTGAWVSGSEP